ncbi:MAG: cupin domain-containing protein, partial [Salinivirgaceae bacterium]|nr:cupin domain-containing protein [Salinivirgaceae bacterium]
VAAFDRNQWQHIIGMSGRVCSGLSKQGILSKIILGSALEYNEQLQVIIPANCWFAAQLVNTNSYGLVTCMVTPSFYFEDFELANREKLINEFPDLKEIIMTFTKKRKT